MADKAHDGIVHILLESCLMICRDYLRSGDYSPEWFTGPPEGFGRFLCIIDCGEGNWIEEICQWGVIGKSRGIVTCGWKSPGRGPIDFNKVLCWWPLPTSYGMEGDE